MKDREHRCSECLQLQDKEVESPYVCEGCERKENSKTLLNSINQLQSEINLLIKSKKLLERMFMERHTKYKFLQMVKVKNGNEGLRTGQVKNIIVDGNSFIYELSLTKENGCFYKNIYLKEDEIIEELQ